MSTSDIYEIRVQSYLGSDWACLFEGLTMRHEQGGQTVISGPALDQAALQAVLARILDLNLRLIAVHRIGGEHRPSEHSTSAPSSTSGSDPGPDRSQWLEERDGGVPGNLASR